MKNSCEHLHYARNGSRWEYRADVQMLINMGFTHNEADLALKTCSTVERAVEYLLGDGR